MNGKMNARYKLEDILHRLEGIDQELGAIYDAVFVFKDVNAPWLTKLAKSDFLVCDAEECLKDVIRELKPEE